MKIGRTLPPAAAPIGWKDLWHGIAGLVFSDDTALRSIEDEIRREFGVAHVFLVSSGTAALTLTLQALAAMSSRREVVIPAYTCFSVPAAVLKAGLRPVPSDITPSTFDFDPRELESALNHDTLCVVAHHLFGVASAVDRVVSRCKPRRIFVVEDAAQAMGATADGCRLGTVGDVAIFSLGRGKNITCGSGGIIITNSDEIAASVAQAYRGVPRPSVGEQLRDLGRLALMAIFIRPSFYWIPAALPFLELGKTEFPKTIRVARMSGMKAGLLRDWRRRLVRSNQARADTAAYFARQLSLPLACGPSHPYLRLPVLVSTSRERDRIYSESKRRGLGVGLAYPTPVNEIPEVRRVCNGKCFPSARRVAENLLTLPTHQWLSDRDKQAIGALCRDVSAA